MRSAAEVIETHQLTRHPEGGWFRETWRAPSADGERGAATSILYLLEAGERSHWHRVDAAELWIFQAGSALTLRLWDAGVDVDAEADAVNTVRLGVDGQGQHPQQLVAPGQWQAAEAGEGWCLVACVVVPAFRFEGFELAPPGWSPQSASASGSITRR